MSDNIEILKAKVEYLEDIKHPLAAEARKALDDLLAGRRDSLTLNVGYKLTLEKFDGDKLPGDGKLPVETIVRKGAL